jgi:hypothetical protein
MRIAIHRSGQLIGGVKGTLHDLSGWDPLHRAHLLSAGHLEHVAGVTGFLRIARS